ncbi:hypothetical protein Y032_0135g1885 [Ancylostoma ceylanicum]|uniref:Uncharacterized protein n=1 Tax=Ancylostoma ceylanicum TaxID=53326 RepID=A0A016T5N4_9BILA|nr:hypothetical protein Y032_0135g1885 [Ancylostoma ceylanicum]
MGKVCNAAAAWGTCSIRGEGWTDGVYVSTTTMQAADNSRHVKDHGEYNHARVYLGKQMLLRMFESFIPGGIEDHSIA